MSNHDQSSDEPKLDAEELNAEQERKATGKVWPKDEPDDVESDDGTIEMFTDGEAEPMEAIDSPSRQKLEDELTAMENKFMRAQAEMDNLRRRAERDVASAHKYALEKFSVELLQVLDSLELGLNGKAEILDDERALKVYEGLELTRDLMLTVLGKFGVVQLNPMGEAFDPKFHEAVGILAADGAAPNTVTAVMQKGYTLNERLIRPAMVMVSQ